MGAQRGPKCIMRLSDNRGGGWGSPGGRNVNQQDKIIKGRVCTGQGEEELRGEDNGQGHSEVRGRV